MILSAFTGIQVWCYTCNRMEQPTNMHTSVSPVAEFTKHPMCIPQWGIRNHWIFEYAYNIPWGKRPIWFLKGYSNMHTESMLEYSDYTVQLHVLVVLFSDYDFWNEYFYRSNFRGERDYVTHLSFLLLLATQVWQRIYVYYSHIRIACTCSCTVCGHVTL